jgi:hypothetical protein
LEIAASCRSYIVRILAITGAGVSAESGIPTFRGKDGYWRNLDPTKLATPEAFARDPQLVWGWVSRAAATDPQCATERRAQSNCTTCPTDGRVPARYAERGRPAHARRHAGKKDGANSWRHFYHALFALRIFVCR